MLEKPLAREDLVVTLKELKIVDKSSTIRQLQSDIPSHNIVNQYEPMSLEDCTKRILHQMKADIGYEMSSSEDKVILRYFHSGPYVDCGSIFIRTGNDEYFGHGWYEAD